MIEGDSLLVKYNDIWNKIKEIKDIKFYSSTFYDEKYIKAKVKEFIGVINTTFSGDWVPKEGVHYNFIACISIDSVMKMDLELLTNLFRKMQK